MVGVDTSLPSLEMARILPRHGRSLHLAAMDAASLGFADRTFDLTLCIQNGICAFHVDEMDLLREAVRVTRSGGVVLLSSYSARFWPDRLEWFEIQAAHGLTGPIDHRLTGDGVISCTDGFSVATMAPEGFSELAAGLGLKTRIMEVDGSSLFCEVIVP